MTSPERKPDPGPRRASRDRNLASYLSQLQKTDPLAGAGAACTARALFIGVLLCALIGIGAIYANSVIKGTYMAWCFSNPIAFFLFLYLVGANALTGLLSKRLALRREELVLIFAMMFVSASLPTFGLVEHLLPMITGVFYYASPANRWAELIHPHVPRWIAPRAEAVITGFYEGLDPGQPIPWTAWVESLGWWLLFLLALFVVSICLVVILRAQWVERERLAYPMMQAPIEMLAIGAEDSGEPPLFRRRLFWSGFSLPAIVGSLNGFASYYPGVPSLFFSSGSVFRLFDIVDIPITLSFSLLGLSFFISQSLGLGIWVFFFVAAFEQAAFAMTGLVGSATLGGFSNPNFPYLAHQSLGAMLMFSLFVLWKARGHLRDVFRKAFVGDDRIDDGGEILSYRLAVGGLLGGIAVMIAWLHAAGVPLWATALFLTLALLIFLALSRIVVEAGVALVRAPLIAPDLMMSTLGASSLGPTGLTGLAYTYPWTADIVTFPMASCANSLKLIGETVPRGKRRPIFWALMLAILVTLVASFWIILYLSYRHGGINLDSWFWTHSSERPMAYLATMLSRETAADPGSWMFACLGAALMWLLMICQLRHASWPLHPLGLAMGGTPFTSGVMWFNVFLAWSLKAVVLKYGGGTAYAKLRSFFIGMILGAFATPGTWLVIDFLTGKQGSQISHW